MDIKFEPYLEQVKRWPRLGKCILAQYDTGSIIVYQAYSDEIAEYAVEYQRFGGPFSLKRMSWIKPNFMWMMFRSRWACKSGQEHVLAIQLKLEGFLEILTRAIHTSYHSYYNTNENWRKMKNQSDVRMQWDPDHDPFGKKLVRRAIQLGLKGDILRNYAEEFIIEIEDITPFVKEQSKNATKKKLSELVTPREEVFAIHSKEIEEKVLFEEDLLKK